MKLRALLVLLVGLGASAAGFAESGKPQALLVVSVDGMRPDTVIEADKHGLKIPVMRQVMKDGAYSAGVIGAMPTSTYPSHTTLITGTAPARHGIILNHPLGLEIEGIDPWYYYSEDLKVPTLWEVAAARGVKVGSISWPVTVGMVGIHYNIPEFALTRTDEDLKLTRGAATPGLAKELAAKAGVYITDNKKAIERDWARTRYGIGIIREKKAGFVAVHLAASDHHQHKNGIFVPKLNPVYEEIDKMIGEMIAAMREVHPDAAVCILSDHGFANVHHAVYIDQAFVKAGLITTKGKGATLEKAGVENWVARAWSAGGSAAVTLKNPDDTTARARVLAFLRELAANPDNGIASILEEKEIRALGGAHEVQFWIDMKPGYVPSASLDGKPAGKSIALKIAQKGTHGYLPTHADMNASFFIAGPGIKRGANLGLVDMRAIAPTLAKVMDAAMPTAEKPALDIFETGRR